MPLFDVIVNRTVYVDFHIDTNTKQEAERIAKERIANEYEDDISLWEDYGPKDITFIVESVII
jgi:hypothetical protein